MGKIVMPKNSAILSEIHAVLQIYNETKDWMTNDIYVSKLKNLIGPDQYSSSYTKKAQITSYFGFTIWEDINNPQSRRKITTSGIDFYNAIKDDNKPKILEVIMNSLENTNFGRNNYGCPQSNSDIEPPCLFIRAIFDLGYLTYKEFAFLLWKMEDVGANYSDSLNELKLLRSSESFTLDPLAIKYTDAKPITILNRWGFFKEDESSSDLAKRIILDDDVLANYEVRLRNLVIYNIDKPTTSRPLVSSLPVKSHVYDEADNVDIIIEETPLIPVKGGTNIIIYGVPGAGKSWTIESEYCKDNNLMERLVFHPDYTYSDFVGQILPKVGDDDTIFYEFTPGPFTKLLRKAFMNPDKMFYLIIEEVNRGNAPAIFGDIFQLLDRDKDGNSEYVITNSDVAKIVFGDENRKLYIPSNMSILCTMNTSDQNVFTLDTAFQRRWNMRLIRNKFNDDPSEKTFAETKILDTNVTWNHFFTEINKIILSKNIRMTSSEDKRLGTHFISEEDLKFIPNDTKQNSRFSEKVLKYLWDDAFKFTKEDIFDLDRVKSLEDVIDLFAGSLQNERFKVFKDNIYNTIVAIKE